MVALVGTLVALLGIAAFCGAGILHARMLARLRRPTRREHRCGACGYSLDGVVVDVCPECGADRIRMEPLTERQRAAIGLWMGVALIACLFGLAAAEPADRVPVALFGTAWVWLNAVVCRQVSMTVYFGILAGGLSLVSLVGFAGHRASYTADMTLTAPAVSGLLLAPLVLFFVHLRRGRIFDDRPRKRQVVRSGP